MSLLPKDWRLKPLAALVDPSRPISYGVVQTGEPVVSGIPCVRVVDISSGKLNRDDMITTSPEISRSYRRTVLREGDVIFALRGDIGKAALIDRTLEGANLTRGVALLSVAQSHSDPRFVFHALASKTVQREIQNGVNGTGLKEIPIGNLRKVHLPVPPLPEQRKIADILSTWDEALEKLDALIAAKERRKQALMQQLLTGKKRVKGATRKWKKVQLGDLAENRSDQNKGKFGSNALHGVTKANGVVPMREHVKGESFQRCKLLEHDWFAYNPMRINIGSIARWQGEKTVMVSGDYVVFRCFEDRLSPAYLDHVRQSWMWQSFVTKGGNGSVRIRIYFSDLAEFTFPCPPIEEQLKIAKILDTADQELALLRRQRDALDRQKRGLMQRLLTGKTRVEVQASQKPPTP